jgi:hypothetical protein
MECGYELKLLEEIIAEYNISNDSFEEKNNNNFKDNEVKSKNIGLENNHKTIIDEVKDDFEIVRPDTEDININEYDKTDKELLNEEKNQINDNNNFNLVRPSSQNVSVKKNKIKKNFSILNQKKY